MRVPAKGDPGRYLVRAVFDSGPLAGTLISQQEVWIRIQPRGAAPGNPPDASGALNTPLQGQPAPDLRVSRWLTGSPLTLRSLRGKVVLIDCWATWCKPCIAALPALERLAVEALEMNGTVIALSPDDHTEAKANQILRQLHITFPAAIDANLPLQAGLGETFNRYHVDVLPTHVVIDRTGIVRYNGSSLETACHVFRQEMRR